MPSSISTQRDAELKLPLYPLPSHHGDNHILASTSRFSTRTRRLFNGILLTFGVTLIITLSFLLGVPARTAPVTSIHDEMAHGTQFLDLPPARNIREPSKSGVCPPYWGTGQLKKMVRNMFVGIKALLSGSHPSRHGEIRAQSDRVMTKTEVTDGSLGAGLYRAWESGIRAEKQVVKESRAALLWLGCICASLATLWILDLVRQILRHKRTERMGLGEWQADHDACETNEAGGSKAA